MNRTIKRGLIVAAVAVVALLGVFFLKPGGSQSVSFRTASVERGDLQAAIGATGTVEPEEVVDVGAQVAGKIVSFGKDRSGKSIDYGSEVEQGMVLAQIDDALYAADAAQARAQVEQAKAGVKRAEADLGQLQAKLVQAERDWNRAKKLGPSDALSQSDYDASLSGFEVAKANLEVGKASIIQAKDAVVQAEASLRRAQQNLDYCTIISPVKGVIIDRRVNIGQTVVSSLNAPSLFLLAKDLKRMQVWVAVNEADIGNIFPGQPVSFTVDAFPGHVFQGEVGKVRLNATMTQNVVNYTVEVVTDNSSGKLLPYLTANVKFILAGRKNVLLIPNAALRWVPQQEQVSPENRTRPEVKKTSKVQAQSDPAARDGFSQGLVWTPRDALVASIPVRVGMSDGTLTEIQGESIKEGTQVVIGESRKEAATASTSSPFTPKLFGSGRGGGGGRQ
ncbi:MAG: efflux RND transporter periplasmic adaptor subunit [Syntrophobacteraceae bacterium]